MSSKEILFASWASQHAPALPVVVSTKPALDNLANVRRTKLALVFTLSARWLDVTPVSHPQARPDMMCTAIENCVLTAITVTIIVTIKKSAREILKIFRQ